MIKLRARINEFAPLMAVIEQVDRPITPTMVQDVTAGYLMCSTPGEAILVVDAINSLNALAEDLIQAHNHADLSLETFSGGMEFVEVFGSTEVVP